MNTTNTHQKVVTEKFEITLLEKGIIENHVFPQITIDAPDILEIKKYNLALAQNNPYVVLVTSRHLSGVTKAAMELTARKDFAEQTIGKALLIESTGHKIVGNFYLRVNKPYIKTKIFSDREKAMEWLRGFIKK
ncbi:MAG: hypothetical protein ABIP51_05375 [Bacteroidia bacterium]